MKIRMVVTCVIAAVIAAVPVSAQCPGTLSYPVQLISGTTWAFLLQDGLSGDAVAGYFTAQAQTSTRSPLALTGVVNVTQTANFAGVVSNTSGVGSYTISPDCSGGTILFAGEDDTALSFAFVFAQDGKAMLLVINNVSGGNITGAENAGMRGTALLQAAPYACTGGADPLNTTTWQFQTQDYESAAIGTFRPVAGTLTISVTQTGDNKAPIQTTDTGAYTINSNCSGGQFRFDDPQTGYSYAFYYASPTELFLVSNNTSMPNVTAGVLRGNHGVAYKQ